jgi:flagellar motility protein MotE (MotC chaperone)
VASLLLAAVLLAADAAPRADAPTVVAPLPAVVAPVAPATAPTAPRVEPAGGTASRSRRKRADAAPSRAPAPRVDPPRRAPALPVPPPPSLTAAALRDELRAASLRRQSELAALAAERARLEKLSGELTAAQAARDAAKDERAPKPAQDRPRSPTGASATGPAAPAGAPVEALAKTLRGMKVDQAAAMVARLERPLAIEVLRRMRPGDAGALLDKMSPEAAAELFALMATRPSGGPR